MVERNVTKRRCIFFKDLYHSHVDRIGGGDSFAAGLLYGFGHEYDPQEIHRVCCRSLLSETDH